VPSVRVESSGPLEIHVHDEGRGEAVVLLGGLTSTVETFGLQIPALVRAGYRVIAPDNRGSGRTKAAADDGVRTPERFAADVRALLDALDLPAVHLVGASMGGMIAQAFALAHPERLRSLVLACTTCGGPHAVAAAPEVVEAMVRGSSPEATEEERRAGFAVVFHPESFERRPEGVRFYEETKRAWPHSAREVGLRVVGIASHDAWARLPEIRVPTLVLTGDRDVLIPPENARILAGRIPDAQLVVIEDAGHVFFCEQPEATNRALVAFLDQVGAASPRAR
jgi:3-oxoadipate enol-lactonase